MLKKFRQRPVATVLGVAGLLLLFGSIAALGDNDKWLLSLCLAGFCFWVAKDKWRQGQ
jgi:hypothetical protein